MSGGWLAPPLSPHPSLTWFLATEGGWQERGPVDEVWEGSL